MNVREIIQAYLKANGFDGLVSNGDCSCDIDDLFPCIGGDWIAECEPGHEVPCDCGEHDFHISISKKPKSQEEAT